MRFKNKVVVVTGGAGGIGSAICSRFATEAADVIVTDISLDGAEKVASEIRYSGGMAEALPADIGVPEDCHKLIEEVLSRKSRIDVLCNNAGINRRGDLLALTDADWNDTISINLNSMYHLCRSAVPAMIRQKGGSIVNTASQWGLHPAPAHIAYNVSKAAVASFTQCLARDYAHHNIRVNAVCPGEIHTPMLESGVKKSGRTMADLDALVPFGRVGKPEEVAALVAFLASDEAPFMCGSLVEITGAQAVA